MQILAFLMHFFLLQCKAFRSAEGEESLYLQKTKTKADLHSCKLINTLP